MPGCAHHVTQRGVRSIDIFSHDRDRKLYIELLRKFGRAHGLRFRAWCLMSNHVHLIVVPKREESLARGIGDAHKAYSRMKNFREGVRGYLFQGRFGSCVLDPPHELNALRYVELNPVRARMARDPGAYKWSSAGYHLGRRKHDALTEGVRFEYDANEWRELLRAGVERIEIERMERHLRTGRPLCEAAFTKALERRLGRVLLPRPPGPPKGWKRKRRK